MFRLPQIRLWKIASALGLAALLAVAAAAAHASDATFDRTLGINGKVDLTVTTGSGSIHIKRGASNTIHIFGRVRPGWGQSDDRAREIATHPPIQQTGNIVRVGFQHDAPRNISIDYEVDVPENAIVEAATGSGDITDDSVGQSVRLSTGSGSIKATGIKGDLKLETGSGGIYAEQETAGDVKVETGSGSIELHHIRGALRAETGSGSIKADGMPVSPWKLETGSGSVEVWSNNTPFTLDAETGSGGVHSDRQVAGQNEDSRHHLTGKVGGGGPLVRIETGSGSIHIH
jgi:hypothetical protein